MAKKNDPVYYRNYYLKNRDKIRATRRLYYLRNQDRLRAYQRDYMRKYRAKLKAEKTNGTVPSVDVSGTLVPAGDAGDNAVQG